MKNSHIYITIVQEENCEGDTTILGKASLQPIDQMHYILEDIKEYYPDSDYNFTDFNLDNVTKTLQTGYTLELDCVTYTIHKVTLEDNFDRSYEYIRNKTYSNDR